MTDPMPLPMQRLPKQTLHHVWAPKLGRPVVLNSLRQLQLWAMLEANPHVVRYVERPADSSDFDETLAADFWALYEGRPTWLVIGGTQYNETSGIGAAQHTTPLRISPEEIDRHRIWIQNWLSLLPYLSCAGALSFEGLSAQVIAFFERDASLADVERHFSSSDPVLVRTAAIAGLHRGHLFSADLLVSPWTSSMRIRRHRRR